MHMAGHVPSSQPVLKAKHPDLPILEGDTALCVTVPVPTVQGTANVCGVPKMGILTPMPVQVHTSYVSSCV